ncbi:TadE family protein [Sinomonas sp. P10A9]|uniref:TadE family protein n=1 Tax=Sinomonas puerhi TaxID=3238584 RepID=A0AB39KZM5_9MICC
MKSRRAAKDRGAVAVEFVLVAPLFFAVMLGIVEFANFFRVQISVTQAAREAARSMAISNSQSTAAAAATAAAPTVGPLSYSFSPSSCAPNQTVTVSIQYSMPSLTGIAGPWTVSGVSAMRCGG